MSPLTASRLARIHMEATTYGAGYRERRMTRRERKATRTALIVAAAGLAWFVVPVIGRALG